MTQTIRLVQFARGLGLPNPSPFCMKLEGILRLMELDYNVKVLNDPRSAPLGKLPYIEHKGQKIADSSLATQYLSETFGVDLDAHVPAEERALHHALKIMLDEHLYFVVLYARWVEEDNWVHIRDVLFAPIPKLLRKLIANKIRGGVINDLKTQGIGRHRPEVIYASGIQDIQSLSTYLGDKTWFGGSQPSSMDASATAYLAGIAVPDIATPMKDSIYADERLMRYLRASLPHIYGDDYQI